jgi:hypothetical protein
LAAADTVCAAGAAATALAALRDIALAAAETAAAALAPTRFFAAGAAAGEAAAAAVGDGIAVGGATEALAVAFLADAGVRGVLGRLDMLDAFGRNGGTGESRVKR